MAGTAQHLSPLEISRALQRIGESKASGKLHELFLFGVLAGVYIGFGANAATTVLSGGGLDPGLAKFLAGSVFCVGLILVLIPGSELFTGNVLMVIGALYGRYTLRRLFRNWAAVYAGNLVGSVALALVVYGSGLLGSEAQPSALGVTAARIMEAKMSLTFTAAICRGILCNMLVCLAVIMAVAATSMEGKILAIYFPIMAFVASGYEHSIANMYFLPAGFLVKGQFLAGMLLMFRNLVPVTLGNILGGLLLVLMHPKSQERIARSLRRSE